MESKYTLSREVPQPGVPEGFRLHLLRTEMARGPLHEQLLLYFILCFLYFCAFCYFVFFENLEPGVYLQQPHISEVKA